MHSSEIRKKFLQYFEKKGHHLFSSSSVVPHSDPTLLFINAGMNQFKDIFLGQDVPEYPKAVTCQKCIRVGGKHNDLENVGHTSRHLTFFEMLGNFSFGDYFKKEAIQFAFEVSTEVFGFDPELIYPTVYKEDDEAFELWTAYYPAEKITRMGKKDNFWAMGDVGPCGPCTELYFDRGEKFGKAKNPANDPKGERFYEFWNLVFMEFNRKDHETIFPLPKPSIDTGAGLERVASLKLEVDSLFETDILRSLISYIEKISKKPYDPNTNNAAAFRVIADHMRTLCFAIADGAQPSNVDRGYVLRKVLRRAVRYGKTLDLEGPFLTELIDPLITLMGDHYSELNVAKTRIEDLIYTEELSFHQTLKRGGGLLQKVLEESSKSKQISGDDAFKLKDTYGFPLEEMELIAKDYGFQIDHSRFEILEKKAKELSKKAHKKTEQIATDTKFEKRVQELGSTTFVGYDETKALGKVLAIFRNGEEVKTLKPSEEGALLLSKTPFYAEQGGQIGDSGIATKQNTKFTVHDTKAPIKNAPLHFGKVTKGEIQVGDTLELCVNEKRREKITYYHSATHLLHWALQQVLGPHIKQAGSLVSHDRLRFDFSHHKALEKTELDAIENLINEKIFGGTKITSYEKKFSEIKKDPSIKQFFGEKYGEVVRVVDIDFSKELCGGTHAENTSEIGLCKLTKESAIAAGIRRVEAVCHIDALKFIAENQQLLNELMKKFSSSKEKVMDKIDQLFEEKNELQQQIKAGQKKQRQNLAKALYQKAIKKDALDLVIAEVDIPSKELRELAEDLSSHMQSGILALGLKQENSCQILVKISPDLAQKGLSANELLKASFDHIDGKGGGKGPMAQAGGKNPNGLKKALQAIEQAIDQTC